MSSNEYMKQWRIENKEHVSQYSSVYRSNPVNKKRANELRKISRHSNGISKTYHSGDYTKSGISYTNEYKRPYRKAWRHSLRKAGKLSVKLIQQVYEENIKYYGRLTCYLCFKPIPFGKDHLEHKTPLSRGGDNRYHNLAVACQHCNLTKSNRLVIEYLSNLEEAKERI